MFCRSIGRGQRGRLSPSGRPTGPGMPATNQTAPPCKFCRLLAGELPAWPVFADEATFAFLDHRPLFPGHVLVVPRRHVATLPELPPELLAPLFGVVRLLAQAVVEALGAEGSFVALNNTVSQSVGHLHVHVVPRRRKDGLKGFFWPRQKYRDKAEAAEVQRRLAEAARRLRAAGW